jgi:hypothetical protein
MIEIIDSLINKADIYNAISKEFVEFLALIIAIVIVLAIGKIFGLLKNYFLNLRFSKNQGFSISGLWLADFSSYIKGKHNIELVKITQEQEKIQFKIQHYNNQNNNNFLKVEGSGVFRASKMSAVYYPKDSSDDRSGVFLLRTITKPISLKGKFGEIESVEKGDVLHINMDYALTKLSLPLWKSIKINLNIPCFKNYRELDDYLKDTKQGRHNKENSNNSEDRES